MTRRTSSKNTVWLSTIGAACLVALATGAASSADLASIKETGAMTVATEDSYRPFEFIEDGKPMGLDHDLLALLREESPFEIRQEIIPWAGLLAGVETGKYDVALTAASITADRYRSLDFVIPITEATQHYVKRADDDSIGSVADLSGKTVGVQSGGASYDALTALKEKLALSGGNLGEVVQYASFPEAYQDLANGRLDYVVNGVVNLISLTKETPRFEMGEAVGNPAYAGWAVAKGNDELLAYLDDFVMKVRENGELARLQEKWIGQSFPEIPTDYRP